jgi:hypothetical protein
LVPLPCAPWASRWIFSLHSCVYAEPPVIYHLHLKFHTPPWRKVAIAFGWRNSLDMPAIFHRKLIFICLSSTKF